PRRPTSMPRGKPRRRLVCGKEPKVAVFVGRPETILFKDFEVGKTYRKKVVLTNVGYATNYCRLLGVSTPLKDFLTISFTPPGPMAAGMSCDLQAVFQPMINQDLEGEVRFESNGGPFSLSVSCITKKCEPGVDSDLVDFGSHVVGQTISRTITLINRGALGTRFTLEPCSPAAARGSPLSSHGPPPSASESAGIEQQVREGALGPFDKVQLEVVFTPTTPDEAELDFRICFSDQTCTPIPVRVIGASRDVPVWLPQPSMDLNICMFDHSYQDNIVVNNSASTALGVMFEVCQEMQKHMKILPKKAFIQAKSSFSFLLKFHPRPSLSKDAGEFFDGETSVLEVPLKVHVVNQTQPVPFTLHAVVTTSDLRFDPTEVDFGHCSVRSETVRATVHLSNLSLLPQEYGFVGVPKFMEVQPNDGFGTLLPLEKLVVELLFSPRIAKEYSFTLTCKSLVNRDFPVLCRGVGVRPPLELSHHMVHFGATAVGDSSTATLHLSHTGKQGPRLFSFVPPQGAQIRVVPSAGRLLPGEKCLLQVSFSPCLSDHQIREEAARINHQAMVLRRQELLERSRAVKQTGPQQLPAKAAKGKKGPQRRPPAKRAPSAKTDGQETPVHEAGELVPSPRPEDITEGSEAYQAGRASLLYSFRRHLHLYLVPCFVSDGDLPMDHPQAQAAWSPQNILYLELQCPAIQPPLVVISHSGQNTIDFQQVAVGQKVVHKMTVENISKEYLDLSSSILDLSGPFLLLNALRPLTPGGRHTMVLAFSPTLGKRYRETLEVRCRQMTLEVMLRGEGVEPLLTYCNPSGQGGDDGGGGLLDFGYILERDSASQVIKLRNRCSIEVRYRVLQASLGPPAALPAALLQGYPWTQPVVGTQNHSGRCVFSVTPVGGAVGAGESQDLTVSFQPDHPSVHYGDRLTVELMSKTVVSLGPLVLLTLVAESSHAGGLQPAVQELTVGCVRPARPLKKNGEFYWDSLKSLQQRGFSVKPSRGTVAPGQTRVITVSWTPPSGYKESVSLTLKGDETKVYRVTMLASVASSSDSPTANQEMV
ncbi:hypothetical protein NHX12_013129, partial [Muraenolepis orangiensis]